MAEKEPNGVEPDVSGDGEPVKLPEGMLLIPLDMMLGIIVICSLIAQMLLAGNDRWGICRITFWVILGVLVVSTFILRRGVRKFVRKHGPVEMRVTFGDDEAKPKKHILLRHVGELVDEGIDRVLDGKQEDATE